MESGGIIAAIATGSGAAALGCVRLSGPGSRRIVQALCPALAPLPPDRRVSLAWVLDPRTGARLDQATLVLFAEGASFTGEEAAELWCHGGPAVLSGVLSACLAAGARPARAGEFTRRALAAGRLDLAQAEAVALLCGAVSDAEVAVGADLLSGEPSTEVGRLREEVLDLLAACESSLDFADDEGLDFDFPAFRERLAAAAASADGWLAEARAVRPVLQGFRVALVGAPNAGKSSLFNAILGRARSIVHAEPGTTRDIVSEVEALAGVQVVLLDTAGLRGEAGAVEGEGIRRAREAAADADLVLLVADPTAPQEPANTDAPVHALVLTKADLRCAPCDLSGWLPGVPRFDTSVRSGQGILALREFVASRALDASRRGRTARAIVAGDRQVRALAAARDSIRRAMSAVAEEAPLEVVATDLREAVFALGEIDGREVTEQVLDRVFARFCVGK